MAEPILEFQKSYRFLSNFWSAELEWEGIVWPHSEAAYQAAKTLDWSERLVISRMHNPVDAKRAGKRVKLRPDWEEVKLKIMLEIVYAKFTQNPALREKLIATGEAHLEEGNNHRDLIWGVCPPGSGKGQNLLGLVLMEVREKLRNVHN